MAIFVGATEITNFALGGSTVTGVYYGANLVWPTTGPVPPAPVVDTDPVNQSVVVGEDATFSASFTYGGTLTYRWQQSVNGGVDWTNTAGTGTSFTVAGAQLSQDQYQYRCVATDEYNRTATTNAATLTVTNPPSGSQTFDQDGTFTVPAGVTQITVTAVAGGGGGGCGYSFGGQGVSGAIRYFGIGGSGGGAGEQMVNRTFTVTPGQTISVVVGQGGAGSRTGYGTGSQAGPNGSPGTDTVIGAPVSQTLRGGVAGLRGLGGSSGNSNGYAWTTRTQSGGGYGPTGVKDGGNAGGASGNGAGANSSQRNPGLDETKFSSTPVSGRQGGVHTDSPWVTTGLGAGNGGSSVFGTGGKGGKGLTTDSASNDKTRDFDGTNGGVGAGGGGGGGNATLDYVAQRGGRGGNGGNGRVTFSWG